MKPWGLTHGERGMPHPAGGFYNTSSLTEAPELKGGNAGLDATPRGLSP